MEFITDSQFYEKNANNAETESLDIFFGGKEVITKGYTFGPYMHDFYNVQYCIRGGLTLRIKNIDIEIREGNLFVIPPFTCVYKNFTEKVTESVYLNIKGSELESIFSELGFSDSNYIFPCKLPQNISQTFEQTINILSTHAEVSVLDPESSPNIRFVSCENTSISSARRQRRNAFFRLLIADLMDVYPQKNGSANTTSPKERHLKKAMSFIENNYNFDITVTDVAKSVNLNRSYLYELFVDNLGMSVQEFITHTRIRNACLLLMDKSIPIQNIASAVKYDPIYFSHIFKKIMGISPRQYRNEVLKTQRSKEFNSNTNEQ